MEYNFVIDCSDQRNEYLYKELCGQYNVQRFGENITYNNNGKYVYIFAPSAVIDDIAAKKIREGSAVFCLKYSQRIKEILDNKNVTIYRYFDDELLAIKNAMLTAEGTLAEIIKNTTLSLKEINTLVLGFGRVGKSVVKLLCDNGCKVSVATNDEAENALAHLFTENVYKTKDIINYIGNFTVIVNSIPFLILKGEILNKISKDCFIIDLASKPGGIDYNQSQLLGLKTLHLLGVPGNFTPQTSGKHIKQSILKVLDEDLSK
jgi:dipicolinate synthase subunit A